MKLTILKSLVAAFSLAALPSFAAPPDGLITGKAKLALWTSEVRSTTVHVDTNDGVVTLYGKVPTQEQKALAAQKSMDIEGVRSVKNLIQVVPASQEKRIERADRDTLKDARAALSKDKVLKSSKMTVKSVDRGVVLLSGEARTFSDHLRAVMILDRLPGVRGVTSEVKSPEAYGTDERISFLVPAQAKPAEKGSFSDTSVGVAAKMRLLTTANVPSSEVMVETEDGVVTLFGIVPTEAVRTLAANEVRKVNGVVNVNNQLEVVAVEDKAVVDEKDEALQERVKKAIDARAELSAVKAAVKNGVVMLTGKVNNGWDELNAVRIARQVSGVRNVEDQLLVDEKSGS